MIRIAFKLIITTLLLHSVIASGKTQYCTTNSSNSFVTWTESEPMSQCVSKYLDQDPHMAFDGAYITIGDNKTPMTIYLGSQNVGNSNPHQTAVIGLLCRGLTSGKVYQGQYTLSKPHGGTVTQQLGWTERMECEYFAGRILNDTAPSYAPTVIRIGTPDGQNTFTMTTPMQTQVGDWIAPELSVEPKSLRLHGIVGGESPEDKFLIKFKNGYTEDLIYPMIRMATEPSYLLLQVADETDWREANGHEIRLPRDMAFQEQKNINVKVRAVDKGHAYKKQLTLRVEVAYEL